MAVKRAELDIFRSKIAVKKAEGRREVLVDYTKPRTIKQLNAEVEKAMGDELSKQAIWVLERQKQIRLEHQIASCSISNAFDGNVQQVDISKGMRGPRQHLFTIVPSDADKPK